MSINGIKLLSAVKLLRKKETIAQLQQPVSRNAAAVHLLQRQAGGDGAAPDLSVGLIRHVVKRLC